MAWAILVMTYMTWLTFESLDFGFRVCGKSLIYKCGLQRVTPS